jgi:hypothetical protein
MKRSNKVVLWMLGVGLGVAILSEEKSTQQLSQDDYANKAECLNDWGTEENCKEARSQSNTHSSSVSSAGSNTENKTYQGPRYYWDRSTGHPVVVTDSGVHQHMPSAHPSGSPLSHSISTAHAGNISRGGFGHFSFRSGGG